MRPLINRNKAGGFLSSRMELCPVNGTCPLDPVARHNTAGQQLAYVSIVWAHWGRLKKIGTPYISEVPVDRQVIRSEPREPREGERQTPLPKQFPPTFKAAVTVEFRADESPILVGHMLW
jgi:hypothetical protein